MLELMKLLHKSEEVITSVINYYDNNCKNSENDNIDEDINDENNNNSDSTKNENIKDKEVSNLDVMVLKELVDEYQLIPIIQNRLLSVLDNQIYRIFRSYDVLIFNMQPKQILDQTVMDSDETILMEMLSKLTQLSAYLAKEPMKVNIIFKF